MGDILEETRAPWHRLLVLAVGLDTYFVRDLDLPKDPYTAVEPRESARSHAGCENATRLVERP